jgi:hypothetical protein
MIYPPYSEGSQDGGGGTITTPEVDTFADLPVSSNSGAVYLVLQDTYLAFPPKLSGFYKDEATGWNRKAPYSAFFLDTKAVWYDDGDNTKKMDFQLSSISTGNTRTITMCDKNIDLANVILNDGSVDFTAVQVGVLPTAANHLTTKEYVDLAVTELGLNFYLNDTASGVGAYYTMAEAETGEAESSIASSSLGQGDDQLLFSFITSADVLTEIQAGLMDVHFHMAKTAGTKPVNVYAVLYEYTAGGASEDIISTTETSSLVTAIKSSFDLHASLATEYDFTSGSRFLVKFYADVGASGSDATITIYQEGTTSSHVSVPVGSTILNDIYVRQDGTKALSANWDAGAFSITALTLETDSTTSYEGLDTGSAFIGNGSTTSVALFSHKTLKSGATTYALAHVSDGELYANAASGKSVHLRVNNVEVATASASGFDVVAQSSAATFLGDSATASTGAVFGVAFAGRGSTASYATFGHTDFKAGNIGFTQQNSGETFMNSQTGTDASIRTAGTWRILCGSGGDTSIRSTGSNNALFVDWSADKVAVLGNSPATTLDVGGTIRSYNGGDPSLVCATTDAAEGGQIVLGYPNTNVTAQANGTWMIDVEGSATDANFRVFEQTSGGSTREWMKFDSNPAGQAQYKINPALNDIDVIIYKNSSGTALEIRASDGQVTIPALAGSGSRNVVADANGVLSAP